MFSNNGGPHEIKFERRLNSPFSYGISICKITQIFKRFYTSKACTQDGIFNIIHILSKNKSESRRGFYKVNKPLIT